ncbi:MAG: 5-oxoprolinase subunit PxpB [Ferruginibacter sp.]
MRKFFQNKWSSFQYKNTTPFFFSFAPLADSLTFKTVQTYFKTIGSVIFKESHLCFLLLSSLGLFYSFYNYVYFRLMTPLMMKDFRFFQISENAISIEFGGVISDETLNKITRLNQCIKENPFAALLSTIPAHTTLTLYFNAVELSNAIHLKGSTALDKIIGYVKALNVETPTDQEMQPPIIHIPVCYDVTFGLDIEELSSIYQLKKKEIIDIHSSAVYTVFMIGFVPGFAYLGGLSEKLTAPRKQHPRPAIAAGSVGIAGQQTGIYPLETPGGWQIIGRTPLTLFNTNKPQPSLLKAGDKIKFEPISLTEFERIKKKS